MTCGNLARRAARRNSRASASSIVLPTQRLLFLAKIWTTRHPASRPRSMARGVPPAMDWCAPIRRSAVATEFRGTRRFYRGHRRRRAQGPPLRRLDVVFEVRDELLAEHLRDEDLLQVVQGGQGEGDSGGGKGGADGGEGEVARLFPAGELGVLQVEDA